jgi:hypothetical protein
MEYNYTYGNQKNCRPSHIYILNLSSTNRANIVILYPLYHAVHVEHVFAGQLNYLSGRVYFELIQADGTILFAILLLVLSAD